MGSGWRNDIVNRLLNVRLVEGAGGDNLLPQNMLASNQQARRINNALDVKNNRIPETTSSSSAIKKSQPTNIIKLRPHNWQQKNRGVKERMSFLFHTKMLSDVHLIIGKEADRQVIPAHSFVLSIGSVIFYDMFYGPLAPKPEEIELPDVDPAAFLYFLKFMYLDEIAIEPQSVLTTMHIARKFAVPALERYCRDLFERYFVLDKACILLTQARDLDEPNFANLCLQRIDKYTEGAFNGAGFTDIDQDTLFDILSRDTLQISEAKIFSAVLRWSKAECIRRQLPVTPECQRMVLGRVFKAIRFPLMTMNEFAMGPETSGLLKQKEIQFFYNYLMQNIKPDVGFLDKPRTCEGDSLGLYNRLSDRTIFTVNKRGCVLRFKLYVRMLETTELHYLVVHDDPKSVCGANAKKIFCKEHMATTSHIALSDLKVGALSQWITSLTSGGTSSNYLLDFEVNIF